MNQTMMAAVLDDQVVLLDSKNAHVLLMDARTEQVWRACTGLTREEIAAELGYSFTDVASTLQELASAGLATCDCDRWTHVRVAWV